MPDSTILAALLCMFFGLGVLVVPFSMASIKRGPRPIAPWRKLLSILAWSLAAVLWLVAAITETDGRGAVILEVINFCLSVGLMLAIAVNIHTTTAKD